MTDKVRCAVVGLGYWGPNLVRNIASLPNAALTHICDPQAERLERLGSQYRGARRTGSFEEIAASGDVDAVLLATPVSTHFPLAMAALRAGKHVFVEKPLAATVREAELLVEEAARRKLVLMVDHIFVYTPAVRRIRKLIEEGSVGDIYYYDSVRINLGLFQHDVNVIWDLAVHDLAIMDYLVAQRPQAVSAVASANLPGRLENIAYLTCFFETGLIGHVHVNWLAPVKVRQTLIGGSKRMVVYDDLEPDEKVKIYDRGVDGGPNANRMLQVGYRLGDMWAPMLDRTEALANSLGHFLDCIRSGNQPITDGECGLRILRLLDAAMRSMQARGAPVDLAV